VYERRGTAEPEIMALDQLPLAGLAVILGLIAAIIRP
jgi:hypothetical protein